MRGQFISFEGSECAGKTTQIQRLAERFRALGREVCILREPGSTAAGERIRAILKDPDLPGNLRPESELFLLCASRCELVHQIILPNLQSGKIVLCDRFIDSTLAYQGYGRGLDVDWLRKIILFSTGRLLPDATIFLDIPFKERDTRRLARENGGGRMDRFDQSGDAFFERVENGFRDLACQESRITQIDGVGTTDEVAQRIWNALQNTQIQF